MRNIPELLNDDLENNLQAELHVRPDAHLGDTKSTQISYRGYVWTVAQSLRVFPRQATAFSIANVQRQLDNASGTFFGVERILTCDKTPRCEQSH